MIRCVPTLSYLSFPGSVIVSAEPGNFLSNLQCAMCNGRVCNHIRCGAALTVKRYFRFLRPPENRHLSPDGYTRKKGFLQNCAKERSESFYIF